MAQPVVRSSCLRSEDSVVDGGAQERVEDTQGWGHEAEQRLDELVVLVDDEHGVPDVVVGHQLLQRGLDVVVVVVVVAAPVALLAAVADGAARFTWNRTRISKAKLERWVLYGQSTRLVIKKSWARIPLGIFFLLFRSSQPCVF